MDLGKRGSAGTAAIRVGTAGWSYADWAGIVYPKTRPAGFHEAAYLARFFDTLEINTSFYRPVPASMAAGWARRVAHNPRFRFTAKLHQSFTHAGNPTAEDERGFRAMADVLAKEDRLGALLMQFPWSFRNAPENRTYLKALLERLKEYPRVVEVRHRSWNAPQFLDLLREHGAGFCNVDQPVIGESLEPSAVSTATVGYVRLHGRNYKNWFAGAREERRGDRETRNARYDYLYSQQELSEWKERVEQVAGQSASTYVITNNHYQGQAAANALQLISLLLDKPVEAPSTLVKAYPQLQEFVTTEQPDLFSGTFRAEPRH